ncbi:MAG: ABC transporter substrate-binding protein [Anaerolineae bacterium]|nr:MAG: ABC transporter substrate-binding protein [Anaerolineae bacterium]
MNNLMQRFLNRYSMLIVGLAAVGLTACAGTVAEPQGVLRVGMQPMVQTDPAFISSDSEVLFANHVYDYLVDVNPQNQIVPRLAAEWSVSDNGLTYIFTLAEDVTFHDGSSLTPEDVVWTLDRLRDEDIGSPTSDLYGNIEAVEAIGDNQVRITLDRPNPFLLYDLSDNHALILKANTEDPATDFNGTGPFKVESYSPEDRIVLTANEDYFVEGVPKLAGMEIVFFNEDSAKADALRGGQIDLMLRMSTSLFESLRDAPGIETYDIPTNGFDLVRLRSDRAPGNDPRVIQAFKLATDRQEIFELIQQGYGAVGRDSPIGPLYADYYSEAEQIPARDIEAARALLAQAGYGGGLQMELHTPDTGGRPDLGAVLKEQWREAGIEVEVIVEPESVYYGDDGWLEVDLGITGWGSRPIPQFYLNVMLKCGAKWNESHFCDQEFDGLADIAGSTLDEAERTAAYQDIQRILIERGPVIIPYYFAQFGAIREGFEGFELKAFAGRTDLSRVSLSQ